MEADTGSKSRQANIALLLSFAHMELEEPRSEGNVPMELGTSNQGESGVGQRGKAVHQFSDTVLDLP